MDFTRYKVGPSDVRLPNGFALIKGVPILIVTKEFLIALDPGMSSEVLFPLKTLGFAVVSFKYTNSG